MFYNPELPLRKHLNHLPHWQQDSAWVFITWRLADSVPAGLLEKWREDRDVWIERHPKPWDEDTGNEFHGLFSSQLELWMDQGMGECVLKNPRCAECVARTILHFDTERYFIDSFVIMPNHVHLLVRLEPVLRWRGSCIPGNDIPPGRSMRRSAVPGTYGTKSIGIPWFVAKSISGRSGVTCPGTPEEPVSRGMSICSISRGTRKEPWFRNHVCNRCGGLGMIRRAGRDF